MWRPQSEQAGRALISYVVASSVGNVPISNLAEPVQIEIAHLSNQAVLSPVCMFWDFGMSGEYGCVTSCSRPEGVIPLSATRGRRRLERDRVQAVRGVQLQQNRLSV